MGDLFSIFSLNPALLDPVGGLLILVTAVILIIIKNKIDPWRYLDSLTPIFGALLPAYFLSLFASGNGFGTVTDLPWGINLWGAIRHPVQLYLLLFSLIPLITVLVYAPIKTIPSGSSFLLFSALTFIYLLFCATFQEPSLPTISGIRIDQILYWSGLLLMLILINIRINGSTLQVQDEIKK
jgi:phosphatidylglycerol:prolipoprotein diacylglycerol transferase